MRTIHLCGETVPHPGHVCAFFDSREQKYDVLVPFLQDALAVGDEVLNIVDDSDLAAHLDSLEARGVSAADAIARGQLDVRTSELTYLRDGEDVLAGLLSFLRVRLERARQEGRSLRTMGEMNWVGRGVLPLKEVLRYEARVNEIVPDFTCTLLCIYDLASTPATLMSDILVTHPYVIIQGKLRRNPHYVPPEEYLEMLKHRPD